MNRGEIQNQIISYSHRADLTNMVSQFVDNVTMRLNRRFGITLDPMNGTSGTNIVADKNSSIYLYGGLREMAIYTADGPAASAYEDLYAKEVSRLNVTYNGDEWDNTVPVILSECEQEVVDAT